ncbi:hypothetical protein O0I10_001240 [Lichtheimia ornata]|uniref:Rho-GAP domain-containing protein n=1 Tax=Lichtheimia ornata TaxID=688661 RepID=A0AAD8DII1_9FUNG|nr:uncharacterized protein O0I10_001240 [Lichtheimia ornata]KAJ8663063.1 hypothetical protein O0I10_001240 [Lichtheimia ornata]
MDIPIAPSPTQNAQIRAWWKRVTKINNGLPTDSDMKAADEGVFGLPLSESILYAHSTISYMDPSSGALCYGVIPTIVAKCGSFLKSKALATEGIFRMSGSIRRIADLQCIFNTPEDYGAKFEWEHGKYTVHDAANVMRRFLNHLPEPVIPLDYYRPFKEAYDDDYDTSMAKIEAFQNLIDCLPLVHQYLLMYIMDMLGLFANAEEKTRMSISSLAAVFAPGILSHPDDEYRPGGYKESQNVLEFLIRNHDQFTAPRSCIPAGQSLIPRSSPANIPASLRRKPSTASSKESRQRKGSMDKSFSTVPQLPSSLPQQHALLQQKHHMISSPSLSKPSRRPSLPFSQTTISLPDHDGTTPLLKRSNTMPLKRVNNKNTEQGLPAPMKKSAGRWKSIRRVQHDKEPRLYSR